MFKVILSVFLLLNLTSTLLAQSKFDPLLIDNLQLWLRADRDVLGSFKVGAKAPIVVGWADQSTQGNHVKVPKQHSNPTVGQSKLLGGKPTIRFEGKGGSQFDVHQALMGKVTRPFDLNQATLFVVAKMNYQSASSMITLGPNADFKTGRGGVGIRRGSNSKAWFTVHNGGDGSVDRLQSIEPPLDEAFHILSVTFDKSKQKISMYVDGKLHTDTIRNSSPRSLNPVKYIQIGGQGLLDPAKDPGAEWFFGGEIAEVLVFNRKLTQGKSLVLSENEFNAVGWYLKEKYKLPAEYKKPILPVDTDGDGIMDHIEKQYKFLDPKNAQDAKKDFDQDGLTNLQEVQLKLKLDQKDTDQDGIFDAVEFFKYKTDPRSPDTDSDGISDGAEVEKLKTNPLLSDSDGDRIPDGFEFFVGTNPQNPNDKPKSYFRTWDEEVLFGTLAVAMDGTVLQFEENREKGQGEVKRSEDGGKTWSKPIIVGKRVKIDGDMSDDGRYRGPHIGWSELGNVIVDENTGDIIAFASSLKAAGVIYRSKDHGKTWKQEKVTIKPDKNGWISGILSSSDPGITLKFGKKKGRLVIPARVFVGYLNKGKGGKNFDKHYSNSLYSDDGGKTWTPSTPFPLGGTGESGLVELKNGSLYHNSRTHSRPGYRRVAMSDDYGVTWKDEHEDDELWDGPPDVYGCKGALLRLPHKDKDILLFSTPGRRDKRIDITVHVSFDGGKTWPYKRLVRKGPGNYTWLAAGRKGTPSEGMIYLLSGKDWMAQFNLAWLMEETPSKK